MNPPTIRSVMAALPESTRRKPSRERSSRIPLAITIAIPVFVALVLSGMTMSVLPSAGRTRPTECAIYGPGVNTNISAVSATHPYEYEILFSEFVGGCDPAESYNVLVGNSTFIIFDSTWQAVSRFDSPLHLSNGSADADACESPLESCHVRALATPDDTLVDNQVVIHLAFESDWTWPWGDSGNCKPLSAGQDRCWYVQAQYHGYVIGGGSFV